MLSLRSPASSSRRHQALQVHQALQIHQALPVHQAILQVRQALQIHVIHRPHLDLSVTCGGRGGGHRPTNRTQGRVIVQSRRTDIESTT